MPNKKSAAKRVRQNEKRRKHNREVKATLKTAVKNVDESIKKGDVEDAKNKLKKAASIIGKTAQKGIIHPRTARRKQSRLAKKLNASLNKQS